MTTEPIADIPCEICNSNVPFNSYIEHVERCFVVSASQNYLQQTIQQSIQHHDRQSQQPMMQTILQLNSLLNSDDDEQDNESTQIILNSDMFFINNSNNSVIPLSRSANELFNIIPILFSETTRDSYEINLEIQEMTGGNVLVPVKNREKAYTIIEELDHDLSCVICLDKPENKQFVRTTCNHVYCKDCIDKWFEMNSKCPICKKDFNDIESNNSGDDGDQEDSSSDCEEENVEHENVEHEDVEIVS
jgi:hypothetical protein